MYYVIYYMGSRPAKDKHRYKLIRGQIRIYTSSDTEVGCPVEQTKPHTHVHSHMHEHIAKHQDMHTDMLTNTCTHVHTCVHTFSHTCTHIQPGSKEAGEDR